MSEQLNDVSPNTDETVTDLAKDYFKKYPNLTIFIEEIRSQEQNSDEPLLSLGKELSRAYSDIETEVKDKKQANKIFIEMKKQAAERMDVFDVTTINKVVKIARNETISKYKDEGKLPNRWSTLALLTSLEDDDIESLIAKNYITANTSRRDLKVILDSSGLKASKKPKEKAQTITLERIGNKHISPKDIEALEQAVLILNWKVKTSDKNKFPEIPSPIKGTGVYR
jgi:hypothetical protein